MPLALCSAKIKLGSIGCKTDWLGHNPRLDGFGHSCSMTERALLCGRELAVWRGERCLFESLHFDLAAGQLALLVGANGSGKTTLLRILAGLGLPTAGSATWKGAAVTELAAEERAQIAYRGHLEALKRELTVVENLAFNTALWGRVHSLDDVLEELKLDGVANMRARYLSAGQRRRVALATLKLQGAKLWLLDEPTTNLDSGGRALLVEWTRRHVMDGGLAVIATHQPDEFATRGALMIELT
jgi:heme exporter protein A